MEGKKVVIGAVLVVVVILAVIFTAKRMTGAPPPPSSVLEQKLEKIDCKSMDLISASQGDWMGKYAADASGRCKNPKTGEYTMVDPLKCGACGQLIPPPDYSGVIAQAPKTAPAVATSAGLPPPMFGRGGDPAQLEKIKREYKCPKCGKSPYTY